VQSNLKAIRDLLLREGDACEVVNITRHRAAADAGVHHPTTGLGVLRLLATLRYDVVHLHVGGTLPSRVVAMILAAGLMPRAKAVLTLHSGGFPSSPAGRAARPRSALGAALRSLDAVIGVNAELVPLFQRLGVPAGRTRLILPHAVSTSAIEGRELEGPLAAFFAAHDPVLLSVGLLEPEYDLELQVRALGRVLTRHPQAGLAIIGSGSLDASLRAAVARTPYADRILVCGDVPHENTLLAIARCSALLRTTIYDGDAVSVREALHLGTPVVATDNGMRPSGVHLIPMGDEAALATAIDAAVAGDDRRPRAVPAADDDANVREVVALYHELLADRR
jgi:glycosyltransferase involved in cell wall biosynthesis